MRAHNHTTRLPRLALVSATTCLVTVLALTLALTAPVARAGPSQCFANSQLCFQAAATPGNPQSSDFLFTTKVAAGWISVGIGEGMDNADMIMLWRTPAGEWTFSRRLSSGYTRPPAAPTPLFTLVNATRTADPATGAFQILLRRPAARASTSNAADRAVVNSVMPMAWAMYSGSGVGANNLPKHTNEGRFEYAGALDGVSPVVFGAPVVGSGGSGGTGGSGGAGGGGMTTRQTALLVHGLCMAVGWSVLSYAAIFVARFMKAKLHSTWFPIHRALFSLLLLLTLIAFALAVATNPSTSFSSLHGILGLLITLATLGQVILGVVIDKTFDPARSGVPIRDKAHWVLGYFLALAAPVNIVLGHITYDSGAAWLGVNLGVLALGVGAFAYGQARIGQVHEHDMARKSEQVPANTSAALHEPPHGAAGDVGLTEVVARGQHQHREQPSLQFAAMNPLGAAGGNGR